MKVTIENNTYTILVKETFLKEGNMEEEIVPLADWVNIVKNKAILSLFNFEETLSAELNKTVNLKQDYNNIRKPILNLSGSIGRLPENLMFVKENSPN